MGIRGVLLCTCLAIVETVKHGLGVELVTHTNICGCGVLVTGGEGVGADGPKLMGRLGC